MKGLLFLSGGGDAKQANKIDASLRKAIAKRGSSKCLYIPLALKEEYFNDAVKWFESQYGYLDSIHVVTDAASAVAFSKNSYDLIYIGGGNTGKLLYRLAEYKLDKYILEHIKNGGFVYGGSAGAIILGKTITIAPTDEFISSNNNHSYNLLNNYSIVPHFDGKFSQRHLAEAKKYNSKLIGLSESSGLVFCDNKLIDSFNPEGIKFLDNLFA